MNIYISGLSYGTNDADLTNLFAEFGEVSSAKVIFDRESGRSRGFAFVEMNNLKIDLLDFFVIQASLWKKEQSLISIITSLYQY